MRDIFTLLLDFVKAQLKSVPIRAAGMIILSLSYSVHAQKLPNIQQDSQWLPATVKIDGKLTEWGDALRAYNKTTLVEYTIANDDRNLYLAIRSTEKSITAKIMAGGISFTINTTGKNIISESLAITFPLTNSNYIPTSTGNVKENFVILTDSAGINNAILKLTDIKVLKFKGVSDTILSVYNEHGIKTRLAFANETLIAEVAIPRDLIGLSGKEAAAFAYNIRLNGVPQPSFPGMIPPPPMGAPAGNDPAPYRIRDEVINPTDFWGKYTLSKN